MADYAISNVARRVVYANTGVGPYAFTFEILANTDIAVYRGSTLLTLTTDYTVTINSNGTGSVTLVTAGTGNITIVGARAIQRTSDYTTGGDLFASTLNTDLDSQTIYVQQVAETAERGLKAPVVDPTDINMTLPSKTDRAGTFLAFDSPSGNPVAGPSIASVGTVTQNIANINTVAGSIANVNTVAGNISNVNTVAGISGNVTTVANNNANVTTVATDLAGADNIGTVAGDIANVNAVGSNIANVIAVDANETNINTVATDLAGADNIGTVAGIAADVSAVAAIDADVTTVASIDSDVTAVAADATDIGTVSSNITNVNTVAGISSNVTTVAGISANVTTVAGISSNVTTVATNNANVTTVATNITNVNNVGNNISNVNSVANNATNINAVVSNATNINTVATNIANVNTNATNISSINTNASNITAIQNASANATAAANSATAAAASATSASNSAAAASAAVLGTEPIRHSVRPSLLLDFANTKTLDPRITFTRGSTATFYDGKTVAKAEENLLTNSEELNVWTKNNSTVTDNTVTAPNGATTADTLSTTTADLWSLFRSFTYTSGLTYTFSVFAKANTTNFLQMRSSNSGVYANFDLSGGTVGNTGGSTTASITSVGNSWYRCSITFLAAGSHVYLSVISSGTDAFATSAIGSIYLWGAQLEQRSSVTAYTATTTAPITNYIPALQTAASGVARFDHNPVTGESLGLLIEEQRTNLLTYSDDFSNAAWTKNDSTLTSNTIVAPDGTLTGDKIVPNTSNATHNVIMASPYVTSNGQNITFSIYAKAGEYRYLYLRDGSSGRGECEFDLLNVTAGTVTGGGTNKSATITSVGNGWCRCTVTFTAVGVNNFTLSAIVRSVSGSSTFAGDGYSGIYIWGAQLEAGSFATSYIPTTTATVTRSADSASMTGTNFSSWYRADAGTFYAEAPFNIRADANVVVWAVGNGATTTNSTFLTGNYANSSRYRLLGYVDSTLNIDIYPSTNYTNGSINKSAFVFTDNDFALSINGSAVSTDTSGSMSASINQLNIGGFTDTTTGKLCGSIKKLAYYPKRLTNAELQGLTTV